jgi:lipoprotein-anchoring transpeptidase ErfK/SrfK
MRHLFTAVFLAGAMLHAQEPLAPVAPPTETASIKSMPASPPANVPVVDTPTPVMPPSSAAPPIAIEIDLSAQKAWIVQEGQRVYETSISSGRGGFETPPGNFKITEKDPDHKSSLYGKIVGADGRVIVSDADSDMPIPAGAKFQQAPMKNFLRFNGAVGMHAGKLPGYPASHGCVRLPPSKAALFFNIVEIGTPVRVFGKTPRTGPTPKKPTIVNVAAAAASPPPVEAKRRGMFWFLRR